VNRSTMRTHISVMLSNSVSTAFSSDEMNRAISQAVDDVSRFVPQLLAEEFQFELDVSSESVTSSDDTEVALANKPVRHGSVTVKNSGETVTYTEDTDYEIDYINGRIKTIGAGDISNGVTIKVTYQKHQAIFNVNSLLTTPIRILAVEWPLNQIPMRYCSFEWHGDFLIIQTAGQRSQTTVADEDQVRIWYTAKHTDPADGANGTFERFLDEPVMLGATAYALMMEGLQQEHVAITDLTSARTALAAADDDQSVIDTAFTNAGTAFTLMKTALTDLKGSSGEPLNDIKTALDKVATHVTEMDTALDKVTTHVGTDAETALDKVTANVVDSNTALDKVATHAGTEADAALDKVDTYLVGGSNSAKAAVDGAQTELDLANGALDKVTGELLSSTLNADDYLDTGDALINTVNVGESPAQLNRLYAETKVNMARAFIEEAAGRVRHAEGLVQESSQWIGIATGFVNEAQGRITEAQAFVAESIQRLSMAGTYISEGNVRIAQAGAFIAEAVQRRAEAQAFIDEAAGRVRHAELLLGEAVQQAALANGYFTEVQTRLAMEQRYLNQAIGYQSNASSLRESSNLIRIEADARYTRFIGILRDRQQTVNQSALASVIQWQAPR
jgi:hypothetical protein